MGPSVEGGNRVRLSDLAKTAIVGAAVGGAAFAPLALLNTQSAGAIPENQISIVLTSNPEYYIHNDGALCTPLLPQDHITTSVCLIFRSGGGSAP